MTNEVSKTCPDCAPDRLVVRQNGDTGVDFLGCVNWPECKHTEPLPLDMQLRRAGVAPAAGVLMSTGMDQDTVHSGKGHGGGQRAYRRNASSIPINGKKTRGKDIPMAQYEGNVNTPDKRPWANNWG